MFSVLLAMAAVGGWGSGGCPGGSCNFGGPPMMFAPVFAPPVVVSPPVVEAPPPKVVVDEAVGTVVGAKMEGDLVVLSLAHSDGAIWGYPWKHDADKLMINGVIQSGCKPQALLTACQQHGIVAKVHLDKEKGGAVQAVQVFNYTPHFNGKPVKVEGPKAPALTPPPSQEEEAPPPRKLRTEAKNGHGCPNADCKCEDCKCEVCTCGKTVEQRLDELEIPNFGVNKERLNQGGASRYWINGTECTRRQAMKAVEGGELPDDAKFDRLTVRGTKAECDAVRKDFETHPAFASLKDKILFQTYEVGSPADEMVKDKGFEPGAPSIYLQDSTGKVKWRQPSYGSAEKLANEINKRRPDYDPSKDPNPDSNPVLPSIKVDWEKLLKHPLVFLAVGVILLRLVPTAQPQRTPVNVQGVK